MSHSQEEERVLIRAAAYPRQHRRKTSDGGGVGRMHIRRKTSRWGLVSLRKEGGQDEME